MPDTARNLIQMTVASVASAGLGTLTLGAAVADYLAFESGDNGLTFTVTISEAGVGKEVRTGCTYTHSGTTLTRGTLEKSTAVGGGAIAFSSAAIVSVTASADRGRRWDSAALTTVAGPNANTSMEVGNLYLIDGSGLTADCTYTLPAVAAVDDRVAVKMSSGSASYEVLLTAASGDTLEGIAGGTEWSRVFITGESVVFRCTVANTTWVVDVGGDGRIPQYANLGLTTDADGEAAATWVLPTSHGGAWTQGSAVGATTTTASGNINIRRAGVFNITAMCRAKDALADAAYYGVRIGKNNAEYRSRQSFASGTQTTSGILNDPAVALAAGDTVQLYYVSQAGGIGARGLSGVTFISVAEVL